MVEGIIEAIEKGDHDLTALRRNQTASLRNLKKSLTNLSSTVEKTESSLLQPLLSRELGRLLSTAAFVQVVGHDVGDDMVHPRIHISREEEFSRTPPYRHLECDVQLERQKLAARSGKDVLALVITELIKAIDVHLHREASKASGNPGQAVRRYILRRLIMLHNQLCKFDESRTQKQFKDLAEQVLAVLGQPTDGLEAAIQRILKGLSTSRNPTRN